MKKNQGFTLIELLVVIAIIGILASVILVSLNSARSKAKDAAIAANLAAVQTQMNLYYNDNGGYGGYVDKDCTAAPYDGPTGSVNAFAVAGASNGPAEMIAKLKSIAAPDDYYAGAFSCYAGPRYGYYQLGVPQATQWAVIVPAFQGGFLCMDSTLGLQKLTGQLTSSVQNGVCK